MSGMSRTLLTFDMNSLLFYVSLSISFGCAYLCGTNNRLLVLSVFALVGAILRVYR